VTAQAKFAEFLGGLTPILRARGFRRRGGLFRAIGSGSTRTAGYQKSKTSDRRRVLFTVNLTVELDSLRGETAWRSRLGPLLPVNTDYWWTVDDATGIEALVAEHGAYFESVIGPALDRASEPEHLIEAWLQGNGGRT
jgi:hypothetical protein